MTKTRIPHEFKDVKEKHPDLHLHPLDDGAWEILGKIYFSGKFHSKAIKDVYLIRIYIPSEYPKELPRVWELSGRIPEDYHKFSDEALCLGTSLNVKINFHENPSLLGFIEGSVAAYLFGYSYKLKYGTLPFGERSHGIDGVIEHYKELFSTQDLIDVVKLLEVLVYQDYQNNQECPCGSGENIEQCHGDVLRRLLDYQDLAEYEVDFIDIDRAFRFRRSSLEMDLHKYVMSFNRR